MSARSSRPTAFNLRPSRADPEMRDRSPRNPQALAGQPMRPEREESIKGRIEAARYRGI